MFKIITILLLIKFLIYTSLIKIEYNRIPIIIISTLISVLLLSLIFRTKRKSKYTIGLIFYTLVSVLLVVNATYYSQFNLLTSIRLIKQISQLNTVGASIIELLNLKILALIIDIPLVFYLYHNSYYLQRSRGIASAGHSERSRGNQTACHSEPRSNLPFKSILIGLALIFIFSYYNINGEIKSITTQEFFTHHLIDIVENIGLNEKPAEATHIPSKSIDELKQRARLKEGKLTGIGKDKNLIVLQVEALQNFVIDLKYDGQEITPNINALISHNSSIYFDRYYQLLGRGGTSDAEFVSQNSLHPSMEEPTYMQYTDNTFYGLPWLLRDNDYTSWVFHGYEKDFWNRDAAYVNQGFQRFISQDDFEFEESIGFGLRDEDFFDQSIDYLKELDAIDDNPFYAFMITLTSHTPFEMPEKYQVLEIRKEHENTMLGDYLQAIHYTDKQIGEFLERLKEEDLYEDTVIALYGDHFALLSTQDQEQKIMTEFLGENYDFDDMMNIPLIIHIPGEDIQETVSKTGSQLDFYPTIANIMGYDNTKGLVFGRDLINYKEKNYIYPQMYMHKGSVINGESVFAMSKDGIYNHSRAYDIETNEPLDIDNFKEQFTKALEEIELSNYILKNDLLK